MLAPLALIPWKTLLLSGLTSLFATKTVDAVGKYATRENAKSALRTIGVVGGQSIGQSAAMGVIAPMVLIEDSLTHQPYMNDLMTVINLRDIRDALSHLAYNGQVGGINITKLIAEVNPNAAASGFLCYNGCEAFGDYGGQEASLRAQDDLSVYSPLAVGRTVVASVKSGQDEGHFPLTFKQIPVPVDKTSLELLFSAIKGGVGFTASIKDYQAGAITYPELIAGAHDIRNEFRIRNNDLSGFYTEANKRGSANIVATLLSGNVSLNTHANTIIISKDTANQVELQNGFRFNSSAISKVRKALKANTIVIVDDARGIFEFLTPVSALSEKYTESQIKLKASKEDSASSLESLVKLLNGR